MPSNPSNDLVVGHLTSLDLVISTSDVQLFDDGAKWVLELNKAI